MYASTTSTITLCINGLTNTIIHALARYHFIINPCFKIIPTTHTKLYSL